MINSIKKNKEKIFNILICLSLTFLICLLSPLNPFSQKYYGTDSWVFQYNALSWKKGMLPYVDFFDHKGILLYLINLIGIILNKNCGIWLVELIFMFFTIFYAKKILDLFSSNKKINLFVLFLVILFLSQSFEGGNLTEEYFLPFAMISQYIFFKFFLGQKIRNIDIIFLGIAFTVVCFLRINMIGLWGVNILIVLFNLFKDKKYKDIFKYILLFVLGIIIIFLPIFIYMISYNIFIPFVKSYILFNLKYSNVTFFEKYTSFKYFLNLLIVTTAIVINIMFLFNKNKFNKNIILVNMLSLVINLIAISLSGKTYMHYAMIIIPNLLLPYILLIRYISGNEIIKFLVFLYLTTYILIPNITSYFDFLKLLNEFDNNEYEEVASYIRENTTPDEKISIYGNKDVLYVLSDRYSTSKYSYQTPLIYYDEKIFDEYTKDIETTKPKIIYFSIDSTELENIIINLGYQEKEKKIFILENEV